MTLAHLRLRKGVGLSHGFPLMPGAVLSVVLLGAAAFPLSPGHLAQFEALNRELGKLCAGNPPRQALNVCRLHAKLVRAF
jgi:hypothetical protein